MAAIPSIEMVKKTTIAFSSSLAKIGKMMPAIDVRRIKAPTKEAATANFQNFAKYILVPFDR